jgi:hypothetical protein
LLAAAIVIGMACAREPDLSASSPARASDGTTPRAMPALRRIALHIDPEFAPEESRMPLAVSDIGQVVFVQDRRQHDMTLTMVDSTGALVGRFARRGAGPGEVRSPSYVVFSGDTTVVVDNEQARLVMFDARLRPITLRHLRFGLRITGGGVAGLAAFAPTELGGPTLVFIPYDEADTSYLLASGADTLFLSVVHSLGLFGRDGSPVALGPSGMILGDGMRYRLDFYDSSGRFRAQARRDVPSRLRSPRELAHDSAVLRRALRFRGPDGQIMEIPGVRDRMAKLTSEPVPYFSTHSLTLDRAGRLWVIGTERDSTFVDMWVDTLQVGRKILPCLDHRGAVSPGGEFIALLCEPEDEDDVGADLQLYRVEELAASADSASLR